MCRSLRCDRRWLQMARNVLERNNIAGDEFSEAIRNPLDKGRGKYRNLYLKGASNCGKTFLLNSLTSIYNTFCNPASTTFALVGAEEVEVLFLHGMICYCYWKAMRFTCQYPRPILQM